MIYRPRISAGTIEPPKFYRPQQLPAKFQPRAGDAIRVLETGQRAVVADVTPNGQYVKLYDALWDRRGNGRWASLASVGPVDAA